MDLVTDKPMPITGRLLNIWRTIIKFSNNISGEEHIFYMSNEITSKDDISLFKRNLWQIPTLILSRPIHIVELEEGLSADTGGSAEEELPPPETLFIDATFKIFRWAEYYKNHFDMSPSTILANYISTNYYDSEDGIGLPRYELSVLKYLVSLDAIDKKENVYPDGDGDWYTLKDLQEDASHIIMPSIREIIDFDNLFLLGEKK